MFANTTKTCWIRRALGIYLVLMGLALTLAAAFSATS